MNGINHSLLFLMNHGENYNWDRCCSNVHAEKYKKAKKDNQVKDMAFMSQIQ